MPKIQASISPELSKAIQDKLESDEVTLSQFVSDALWKAAGGKPKPKGWKGKSDKERMEEIMDAIDGSGGMEELFKLLE